MTDTHSDCVGDVCEPQCFHIIMLSKLLLSAIQAVYLALRDKCAVYGNT